MQTQYHTHHSPCGAFASFTAGLHHATGGFGHALAKPANQNLYIGYRVEGGPRWTLLPFLKPRPSQVANFTGDVDPAVTPEDPSPIRLLRDTQIDRRLEWASDTWRVGRFSFTLHTPFDHLEHPTEMPESKQRFVFAPLVCALLEYDNSSVDHEIELIFGMHDPDRPMRPLSDNPAFNHIGFATGTSYGYATTASGAVRPLQGLNLFDHQFKDASGYHRIGQESALVFRVKAGEKASRRLVLGFYESGQVTTGIEAEYYYARLFSGLEDVLDHGFAHFGSYVGLAERRNCELRASPLSEDQEWLLSQSTHSYYGCTELLRHKGKSLWVVNEGEYRMMNTFDLTADHLFFELAWHPWAVRDTLEWFASHYSYRDRLHAPDGRNADGGVSFCHDMGVANQFSPSGHSSYECCGLTGCFSHMTAEQLLNWILCAITYALKTGDLQWLQSQQRLLLDCRDSLLQRDDPDPARRNGLIKWDSNRCGPAGSEITTYDSLDVSLGQARNNLYLAVKTLGAWFLMEEAFRRLSLKDEADDAANRIALLASTICSRFEAKTGMFPAVFEKGNHSRILPAVEGFVYPLYLDMQDRFAKDPEVVRLLNLLEQHIRNALTPGICLDAESGGWKISSTSHNTWFSKIAIAQHVIRRLFPDAIGDDAARGDAIHRKWQSTPGCGAMALCDQIDSRNGQAIGSRYYPRGVSAILWLYE